MTTRISGIAMAIALAVAATACNGDENSPTGPSAVPSGATSAEVATSTTPRNGPTTETNYISGTPRPAARAGGTSIPIGQSGGGGGGWTDGDTPQRNHDGPNIEAAPKCATNVRIDEKSTFPQVIPYDGKRLVGVIYVKWDWDASLCSGGARYRTTFEVIWDGDGEGDNETERFAGYARYQPTTYYVQEDASGIAIDTHTLYVGTQIWHDNHWNEATWDFAGSITFKM